MNTTLDRAERSEKRAGLPFVKDPELIFGVVAPVGVDLDFVNDALARALAEVKYAVEKFRITRLMQEVQLNLPLDATGYIDSIRQRIEYANDVCQKLERNDALAILAVSAIREFRQQNGNNEEEPLGKQAYILHQFKRPEEVKLLRAIYGRQFIQVSVHASEAHRINTITRKELDSKLGLLERKEAMVAASDLVKQDDREGDKGYGQNVRDAFPLGDVFIDSTDEKTCEATLRRFVNALFGDNQITPDHDEYGMYIAKSAALRSSALTRQVGAAIFRPTGEIVSMGCNEVPKAGGGTYWSGDENDKRDFVDGHDPNHLKRVELLSDVIARLAKGNHLSESLSALKEVKLICDKLFEEDAPDSVNESRVMDVIEFGRDIHAEMSAISDAARTGVSVRDATLYCTTFPCHICAKHIVAAGIKRVVYMEPYAKSYAAELHADSIEVDGNGKSNLVSFQRFIGLSPYRYRDLFEKGARKYSTGEAQRWNADTMRPMIDVMFPSYSQAEVNAITLIAKRLSDIQTRSGSANHGGGGATK